MSPPDLLLSFSALSSPMLGVASEGAVSRCIVLLILSLLIQATKIMPIMVQTGVTTAPTSCPVLIPLPLLFSESEVFLVEVDVGVGVVVIVADIVKDDVGGVVVIVADIVKDDVGGVVVIAKDDVGGAIVPGTTVLCP
jgi:hypothetical protein